MPITPLIYRGAKRAKFGFDLRHQSLLTHSSFEMEQHIGNLKHFTGVHMIALNTDLEIWPTPPLISVGGYKSAKFRL